MSTTLDHSAVRLVVTELGEGTRRVDVEGKAPSLFVPLRSWTTRYPVPLVERILAIKGEYVLDEIRREEDPSYVEENLREGVLPFVEREALLDRSLLDFGSGCGASALVLARLFPSLRIVGVELVPEFVEVARARAKDHGVENVEFRLSPSEKEIPAGIGRFDFAMMSAVFEHLLPGERAPLLRQVWSSLSPGGILFLNQTPNRHFPIERHTTHLPLINYLPDGLAFRVSRRLSRRTSPRDSWETLLRKGIRGGSEREVLSILRAAGDGEPERVRPLDPALRDGIDLWFRRTPGRRRIAKRLVRGLARFLKAATGIEIVPDKIALAVRKSASR